MHLNCSMEMTLLLDNGGLETHNFTLVATCMLSKNALVIVLKGLSLEAQYSYTWFQSYRIYFSSSWNNEIKGQEEGKKQQNS